MPAQSQQQQKLFGLALSVKRGETPRSEASEDVLNIVDSMTEKEIEDFAGTSHKGLPKKVEEVIREEVRGVISENIPKMYKVYLGVQKKLRTMEDEQKKMLAQFKSEKDPKKKRSILDKMKDGTKRLQKVRANLDDIENEYINKMAYDTSYSESINEVNPSLNKKVKKYLDAYLKGEKKNSPEHQHAIMLIMKGALTDANFHSEARQLDKFFPKAKQSKHVGTPMEDVIEDKGVDIAGWAKWDGYDIIDAFSFYTNMVLGGGFGKKLETLKESVTETINERLTTRDMKYMDGLALRKPLDTALKELRKVGQDLIDSEGFDKGDVKEFLLSKVSRVLHVGLSESTEESVNEAASRTAMEIGGLTGMNKDFIQKFVDTNELDIEKVFQFVKKGKLKDRLDFVSAVAGKPNNPLQKKMIKMFK